MASRTTNSLSIRGGRIDQNATYVDGVPVQAGYRGTSQGAFQDASIPNTEITISADAFEQAAVTTGATSSEFGNAQAGVISVATRSGGNKYNGSLSYENDAVTGANSLGYNRITGGFGGPLLLKGLTFFLSGTLEGQQSIPTGRTAASLRSSPRQGSTRRSRCPAYRSPTADTTLVPIRAFALVTGDCGRFTGSINRRRTPLLENNYGVDCQGPGSRHRAIGLSGLVPS